MNPRTHIVVRQTASGGLEMLSDAQPEQMARNVARDLPGSHAVKFDEIGNTMNTTRYANHNAAGMALGLQSGELYEQEEDCHTCITQHTHYGHKFEVYYDELAGPFSQWKAFCSGIGTKSGLDRDEVIKAMRQAITQITHP